MCSTASPGRGTSNGAAAERGCEHSARSWPAIEAAEKSREMSRFVDLLGGRRERRAALFDSTVIKSREVGVPFLKVPPSKPP